MLKVRVILGLLMSEISVEHVTVTFPLPHAGGALLHAVNDVSLRVPAGDSVAIVGPSGCGKTTLLRVIAGLQAPDSGRVTYNHVPLKEIPNTERGIGMVFQDYALIPHWETGRTVGFFLHLRQRDEEVPERVRQVSSITGVGIEHLLGRFPRELSGGEKQRVAIARAFARDLSILLFDDPFANLDAKFRATARLELRRLLDRFPVTMVLVTHDQHEAAALAKRIVLMRDGKIEQAGPYTLLYENPINLFVAGFIGLPAYSFFAGEARAGHWQGESFGPYPLRSDLADGTDVTLAIRPKHIHLQSGGVPAVVEAITPNFGERHLLLDVWLGKERWQIQAPLETQVERGQTVYCMLDAREALYFDTRSGQRLA